MLIIFSFEESCDYSVRRRCRPCCSRFKPYSNTFSRHRLGFEYEQRIWL